MSLSPVTIGVAVRFEPPDWLQSFVGMLVEAARHLDKEVETEVLFCLNGSGESTTEFLQSQALTLDHTGLPFRCIKSPVGKIAAHRAIARQRRLQGHLLFVDADVGFDPILFRALYDGLKTNPSVKVSYAEVEALPSVADGILRHLQDAYYRNRHRLPRRRHLHGRCFLLRDWHSDFDWDATKAPPATEATKHLSLNRGPLVDDIHYSRVLAHHFGPAAILQAQGAVVRFHPPDSWAELYRDSFRTEFELFRLAQLYPQSEGVEREVFSRDSHFIRCMRALFLAGPSTAVCLAVEAAMRTRARTRIRQHRECPKSWKAPGQNHHA